MLAYTCCSRQWKSLQSFRQHQLKAHPDEFLDRPKRTTRRPLFYDDFVSLSGSLIGSPDRIESPDAAADEEEKGKNFFQTQLEAALETNIPLRSSPKGF